MNEELHTRPVSLSDLQERVRRFALDRDWLQFHNPRNVAAAIAVEAAELLHCFQWKSDDECQLTQLGEDVRRSIESEMADVIIYVLNLANAMDVDASDIVLRKLTDNASRFPSKDRNDTQAP